MTSSSLSPAQLAALLNGPGLEPPPGVTPNFVDPPNTKHLSVCVMLVCLVLATLAVSMRIYTKAWIIRRVIVADFAIVVALAAFVGYFVCTWSSVHIASRVHQWDVQLKNVIAYLKFAYVAGIMYAVCVLFLKVSILLQLIDIFAPGRKSDLLWWASWLLIAANSCYYIIFIFTDTFACRPVAASWNPLIHGRCLDQYVLDFSAGIINTVTDVVILLLPQYAIWRLNRSWRRKLGVSFIFLLGIFASASSAVRLAYSIKVSESDDLTYYGWFDGIWSFAEMTSGLIIACLPVSIRFFSSVAKSPIVSHAMNSVVSLIGRTRGLSTSTSQSDSGSNTIKRRIDLHMTEIHASNRSNSESIGEYEYS